MKAETDQTTLPDPDVWQDPPDIDEASLQSPYRSSPSDSDMPGLIDRVDAMWPGASGSGSKTVPDDAPIATAAETQTLPGDESPDLDLPTHSLRKWLRKRPLTPEMAPVAPLTPGMAPVAFVAPVTPETAYFAPVTAEMAPVAPDTPEMDPFAPEMATEDELLRALEDDAEMADDALEDDALEDDADEPITKKAKTDKD